MLSWLASQLRLNVGSGRNRRSGLDYPSSGSTSSSLPRSPSPMGPLLDLPSQPRLCGNTQEPWGRMWTLPPQLVWEKGCALGVDQKSGQERCAASWRLRRSAAAKKWMQRFRQRGNLRLGRLPAKDILPTATMRAKAPAASHKKCDSGPTLGRILGAAERPPFGGRVLVFC